MNICNPFIRAIQRDCPPKILSEKAFHLSGGNTIMNEAQKMQQNWKENPRWKGVTRPYSPEDVL
jgi:hypothetical protein